MADSMKEKFSPIQVLVHIETFNRICDTWRKNDCYDDGQFHGKKVLDRHTVVGVLYARHSDPL